MKDFDNKKNPRDFNFQLKNFLTPTAVVPADTKPTITTHYLNTFKKVDNFNALLSSVEWPYKQEKVELVWFINCLRMITINAWSLWMDLNSVDNIEDPQLSIKEFVRNICNQGL
ncbi:MAG: hypothetical protein ACRDFB_04445 [Rhabdochlamydiaceae bacterium]